MNLHLSYLERIMGDIDRLRCEGRVKILVCDPIIYVFDMIEIILLWFLVFFYLAETVVSSLA